jgi:hypothetical protein
MDTWIRSAEFSRKEFEEDTLRIEGGADDFNRITEDDSEPDRYLFQIKKSTKAFDIQMEWGAIVEEPDEYVDSEEELEVAKSQIKNKASYYAATYLDHMDMPPIQGLFYEEFMATLTGHSENIEDGN